MPGPTVVLVHGVFADASGFAGVTASSRAPATRRSPRRTRCEASPSTPASSAAWSRPSTALLCWSAFRPRRRDHPGVGRLENVTGLVFLAAFGLEVGESCASVQQPFPLPRSPRRPPRPPTTRPAPQAVPTYTPRGAVPGDVLRRRAGGHGHVMFATQRPLAAAALNENAIAAGWKSKPSWFLVSEHDNAISPDADGSWRSGWAPRPTPSTARTPPSSPSRSPWPRSSGRRCGDLVDRDVVPALPGERAAVPVLVALPQPQAGEPDHGEGEGEGLWVDRRGAERQCNHRQRLRSQPRGAAGRKIAIVTCADPRLTSIEQLLGLAADDST